MPQLEKNSINKTSSINTMGFGCAVAVMMFFIALYVIISYFLVPLSKGF